MRWKKSEHKTGMGKQPYGKYQFSFKNATWQLIWHRQTIIFSSSLKAEIHLYTINAAFYSRVQMGKTCWNHGHICNVSNANCTQATYGPPGHRYMCGAQPQHPGSIRTRRNLQLWGPKLVHVCMFILLEFYSALLGISGVFAETQNMIQNQQSGRTPNVCELKDQIIKGPWQVTLRPDPLWPYGQMI